MADPFLGEIRMFGGNFAPVGWAICNGALLPISIYDALYALLGTTYGGDGITTFALPDLRGRVPIHQGTNPYGTFTLGEVGGTESVTLTTNQIPAHTHAFLGRAAAANSSDPTGRVLGTAQFDAYTASDNATVSLASGAVGITGSSLPHDTMGPYLAINYIIALEGIFPSQG